MKWEYHEEELVMAIVAITTGEEKTYQRSEWRWVQYFPDWQERREGDIEAAVFRPLGDILASLGADGWELVGFTPDVPENKIGSQTRCTRAVFKRPVD
jgi:hypothetical protein